MEKYVLENNDYIEIKKLIDISESIFNLYKKLYKLEIDGKNNTDEYKQVLDYLEIALNVENKLYKNANLDSKKCYVYLDYLFNDRLPSQFLYNSESVINLNNSNFIVQRVYLRLENIYRIEAGLVNDAILDELNNYQNDDEIDFDEIVYQTTVLTQIIEKDIYCGFVYYLDKLLNNKLYEAFRDDLIEAKYNMCFLNKSLESELFKRKYNVPSGIISSIDYYADDFEYNLDMLSLLKNYFGAKNSMEHILKLLDINDENYQTYEVILSSVLRQCFLKASLKLSPKECLDELSDEFNNYVKRSDYLNLHKKDRISKDVVNEYLDDFKNEKVLDLRYRNY